MVSLVHTVGALYWVIHLRSLTGVFLFFIFLGLSMLLLQLVISLIAIPMENARRHLEAREQMARRLCYAKSGKLIVAPRIGSGGYHIFLSHVVS
jgi:hypothetical protein